MVCRGRWVCCCCFFFFFQAEDGIRDLTVTGVQTCALPICWQELREEDLGALWEHFVLNEIMARLQSREVFYWRDKRGHEIDFVLASRRKRQIGRASCRERV